jgi:hypothetical protein
MTSALSLVFVFMNYTTEIKRVSSPTVKEGLNNEVQAFAYVWTATDWHRARLASVLMVALVLLSVACRQASSVPPQTQPGINPSPKTGATVRTEIGFATRQKFLDHYDKHGREFGSISKEVYLRQAQELRDGQVGSTVLEAVRNDGVTTRFDKKTGAFLAFNSDLTIRTFFKPNDGEAYFQRQRKRGSNRSSKGGDNE